MSNSNQFKSQPDKIPSSIDRESRGLGRHIPSQFFISDATLAAVERFGIGSHVVTDEADIPVSSVVRGALHNVLNLADATDGTQDNLDTVTDPMLPVVSLDELPSQPALQTGTRKKYVYTPTEMETRLLEDFESSMDVYFDDFERLLIREYKKTSSSSKGGATRQILPIERLFGKRCANYDNEQVFAEIENGLKADSYRWFKEVRELDGGGILFHIENGMAYFADVEPVDKGISLHQLRDRYFKDGGLQREFFSLFPSRPGLIERVEQALESRCKGNKYFTTSFIPEGMEIWLEPPFNGDAEDGIIAVNNSQHPVIERRAVYEARSDRPNQKRAVRRYIAVPFDRTLYSIQ